MRCGGSFGVTPVLVGLNRIGIVGLPDALKKAKASGLTDRERVVDLLFETLTAHNYVPEGQQEDFRTALWREYLRHAGEDPSEFYSEIEVTVRGQADPERDRSMLTVIAAHEVHDLPVLRRQADAFVTGEALGGLL